MDGNNSSYIVVIMGINIFVTNILLLPWNCSCCFTVARFLILRCGAVLLSRLLRTDFIDVIPC